jgi:hypothetical protein
VQLPSTFDQLVDDLEVLANWKEDIEARADRAVTRFWSRGLLEERAWALVNEKECWLHAAGQIVSRCKNKKRSGACVTATCES